MMEAFVLIVTRPGYEERIVNALKGNPRVKEVYRVYGEYDVIIRVEVEDLEGLDDFHDYLRRIGGIETTETLIASSRGARTS